MKLVDAVEDRGAEILCTRFRCYNFDQYNINQFMNGSTGLEKLFIIGHKI